MEEMHVARKIEELDVHEIRKLLVLAEQEMSGIVELLQQIMDDEVLV